MRGLAPELVDGIIDHLDFSGVESTAEWMLLRKTLKACSLVNSRFRPRSQFHILSNVTADSAWDDWSIQALSNLLRSSTHIGPYIKRLGLYLGDELEGTEGQGIAHIVSCATRLITIDFSGCSPLGHGRPKPWQQYPLILRTAWLAACSLPFLRAVVIRNHLFANIAELESILRHCPGLKELHLDRITFTDKSPTFEKGNMKMTLDTLFLEDIRGDVARVIFQPNGFGNIDLTHLRILKFKNTPLILGAGTSSIIQELHCDYLCGRYARMTMVPPRDISFRSVDICEHSECIEAVIELCGLASMKNLQRITLRLNKQDLQGDPFFAYLDTQCRNAFPDLAEVNLYLYFLEPPTHDEASEAWISSPLTPSEVALVGSWLPYIRDKGILHVYRDEMQDHHYDDLDD
ncbi:hypothetical protein B0H11DRAFT_2242555 [Mycena galericulata]|nr:hypothetical protein B0H11DRAFT_2242555 [Mycena galericulata]